MGNLEKNWLYKSYLLDKISDLDNEIVLEAENNN